LAELLRAEEQFLLSEKKVTTADEGPVTGVREGSFLLEKGAGETPFLRFCLYGELCCNKNIYDYAFKRTSDQWLVFGLQMQVQIYYDIRCSTELSPLL